MNTATAALPLAIAESKAHRQGESYEQLLLRLSELSVRKCYDPYKDIAWDAPENALTPGDPRLCIDPEHPLVKTAWYEALDGETRARFGLEWTMQQLKYGVGFEAVLGRGLLEFCQTVPNGSLEHRYALHEVVEEGRHSLMFQEVIARSGCNPQPIGYFDARIDDRVARWGRTFPQQFFFCVLAGELFIDEQNRAVLRQPVANVHPLLRRVMQIHVTEEARHVCFAENYLREHMPRATAWQRTRMAWAIPVTFSDASRMMTVPDARVVKMFGIPKAALRRAFGRGTDYRREIARITQPIRELCAEHGLYEKRHALWWKALGLA